MRAVDPAADSSDAGADMDPAAQAPAPASDGPVHTQGLVTVLDDGSGPQMCLGAVARSYPPQCSGVPMTEFDWGQVGAEEAGGVKWGSYALTGTFDGTTFTATDAIPAALYDAAVTPEPEPLAAACDSPTSTDAALATPEAMDATTTAAAALPGYATQWLTGETLNVAVTEDVSGAEATLRETWGGPLCVTTAEYTEAQLNVIGEQLQAAVPTLVSSGSQMADSIQAQVVLDNGSIQAWADATYGPGLVTISSALVPAGS